MNDNSLVGWLAENIPLHLEWCKTFVPGEGETRESVIRNWIAWGLMNGLLKVFLNEQSPVGYIFARPCMQNRVITCRNRYFETLFEFDRAGSIAWIDTLWAPGCYAEVLDWLRSTRRRYVAWQHKGGYYLIEIAALDGDKPIKSQIARARIIAPIDTTLARS